MILFLFLHMYNTIFEKQFINIHLHQILIHKKTKIFMKNVYSF